MYLELKRVVYLGYWKIFEQIDPKNFQKRRNEIAAELKLLGLGGVRYKYEQANRLEGPVNKLDLREKASTVISEIAREVAPFEGNLDNSVGMWHKYAGVAAFAFRSHDDFRGASQRNVPNIALWASEIENSDGTVTLLFLHGTADGNLQGTELENMPSDRSGSGTEKIFEYLWAQGRELPTEEHITTSFNPGDVAERCVWMIGTPEEHQRVNIEALFRVHYDEIVERSRRQVSPLSRRSGDKRPALVSRIVIGSPILVQSPVPIEHRRDKYSVRFATWILEAWKKLVASIRRVL